MKQHGTTPRRMRNRSNGKRHPVARNQTFESNGPDGKIRGTAQQVLDRYLALARDASSAGDPITAESYFQHAEHYYRVMGSDGFGDRMNNRPRPPGTEEQPFVGDEKAEVAPPLATDEAESANF